MFGARIGHGIGSLVQRKNGKPCALSGRGHLAHWFFGQQLRDSLANGFVRIERREEIPHVHAQDLPQIAQVAVTDMMELCHDLRDATPANVPTGKLKVQREIGLRPTSLTTQSADNRPDQISMGECFHSDVSHSATSRAPCARFGAAFQKI